MAEAALLQLADDLAREIEAMDLIVGEAAEARSRFAQEGPSRLELRGLGDLVHDFYSAVERYLERVAVEMNGGLAGGASSHVQLLERMARPLADVRPAVLSPEVRDDLREYLRFRHLFRHRYGFELEWNKVRTLLDDLPGVAVRARADLEGFRSTVEALARAQ